MPEIGDKLANQQFDYVPSDDVVNGPLCAQCRAERVNLTPEAELPNSLQNKFALAVGGINGMGQQLQPEPRPAPRFDQRTFMS